MIFHPAMLAQSQSKHPSPSLRHGSTLGHFTALLVDANEIAAGQNIIATMPQSDVSPSVVWLFSVCLSVCLSVSIINQTHSRTCSRASIESSSNHRITQSLSRNAHYATSHRTETTIFQLSDQKFEHMMIIDDKRPNEMEQSRRR